MQEKAAFGLLFCVWGFIAPSEVFVALLKRE
jgi:hypothetical protein